MYFSDLDGLSISVGSRRLRRNQRAPVTPGQSMETGHSFVQQVCTIYTIFNPRCSSSPSLNASLDGVQLFNFVRLGNVQMFETLLLIFF